MNVNNITVIIDNQQTLALDYNDTLYDNGTHRWIYFAFEGAPHEVLIVPEFPSLFIFALFITTTFLAIVPRTRQRHKNPADVKENIFP